MSRQLIIFDDIEAAEALALTILTNGELVSQWGPNSASIMREVGDTGRGAVTIDKDSTNKIGELYQLFKDNVGSSGVEVVDDNFNAKTWTTIHSFTRPTLGE